MFGTLFDPVVVAAPVAPVKEKAPDVEVDLSVLEELDFSPACEVRHFEVLSVLGFLIPVPKEPPCPNEAEWLLTCKGCGFKLLCCDSHLSFVMQCEPVTCGLCPLTGTGCDVYRFAPLES